MTDERALPLREAALYFSAQQFLTRLPNPSWVGWSDDRLARAAKWFPAVGLVLGVFGGALWLAGAHVLPPALAAGLSLAFLFLLTGGLHEDGLADCCDGLGGSQTRERALDIMRDSRIGAYGALALITSIGLRWSALASLGPWSGAAALVIALIAGRVAMTMMLWAGTYAREDGAAQSVAGGVTTAEALFAGVFSLCAVAVLGGLTGVLAAVAALLAARIWLMRLTSRLGGYTGDGLGAGEQIAQIIVLCCLAGAWA